MRVDPRRCPYWGTALTPRQATVRKFAIAEDSRPSCCGQPSRNRKRRTAHGSIIIAGETSGTGHRANEE
jgi:hypothetical protein